MIGERLVGDGWSGVIEYNEELKHISNKSVFRDFDIMKIYETDRIFHIKDLFSDKTLKLIWERKEDDLITSFLKGKINNAEFIKGIKKELGISDNSE